MAATNALQHVYNMPFATVYPMYVDKAEKKARTKREVDQVIRWLTGFTQCCRVRLNFSIA